MSFDACSIPTVTLRGALAVLLAAAPMIAAGGTVGSAQPDPDFSGRWALVSVRPDRTGFDQFWLDTEAVVTHTASSLEIARVGPTPARVARFLLDGSESRNVYTVGGQRLERDAVAATQADAVRLRALAEAMSGLTAALRAAG